MAFPKTVTLSTEEKTFVPVYSAHSTKEIVKKTDYVFQKGIFEVSKIQWFSKKEEMNFSRDLIVIDQEQVKVVETSPPSVEGRTEWQRNGYFLRVYNVSDKVLGLHYICGPKKEWPFQYYKIPPQKGACISMPSNRIELDWKTEETEPCPNIFKEEVEGVFTKTYKVEKRLGTFDISTLAWKYRDQPPGVNQTWAYLESHRQVVIFEDSQGYVFETVETFSLEKTFDHRDIEIVNRVDKELRFQESGWSIFPSSRTIPPGSSQIFSIFDCREGLNIKWSTTSASTGDEKKDN